MNKNFEQNQKEIENIRKKLFQNIALYFKNNKDYNLTDIIRNINLLLSSTLFEIENIYTKEIPKHEFKNLKIARTYRLSRIVKLTKEKIEIPLPNHKYLTSSDIQKSVSEYFKNHYNNYKYTLISKFNFEIIQNNNNNNNNMDVDQLNINDNDNAMNLDDNSYINNEILNLFDINENGLGSQNK